MVVEMVGDWGEDEEEVKEVAVMGEGMGEEMGEEEKENLGEEGVEEEE